MTRAIAVFFLAGSLAFFALPAGAEQVGQPPIGQQPTGTLINQFLNQAAEQGAGFSPEQAQKPVILFQIIRAFLALLGAIFLILMLYGGFLWMTARGNEQQVEKAKETITRGVIGLIIILASLAISRYVIYSLIYGKPPLVAGWKPGQPTNQEIINYNVNTQYKWSPW